MRLRTFIALELDPSICDHCVSVQETLSRAGMTAKWVETDNLHLTLLFLGEVDERDVIDVCRAVARVCRNHQPFELAVEGVGCFPNPSRPRTVWAGVTKGVEELVALHEDLEEPLLQLGCYRREERQFTPHITLGRLKGEDVSPGLAAALTRLADWKGGETEIDEVLVLSSHLQSDGPVYAVLSRAPLGE